jgi:prepilin signal peptidase PulO-like enzyme (type II secretory pathway)
MARQRRMERFMKPPTWRGAFNRASIAALAFALIMIFALDRPPLTGLALGALMLAVYVPMTYFLDSWMYRRHQRMRARSANPPRPAPPAAEADEADPEAPKRGRLRRALPGRRQGE